MAIVGLKKISPFKVIDPITAISLGSSVLGLFGAGKARKDSRRRDAEARERLAEAREAYNAIEFTNPLRRNNKSIRRHTKSVYRYGKRI